MRLYLEENQRIERFGKCDLCKEVGRTGFICSTKEKMQEINDEARLVRLLQVFKKF